MDVGEFNGCRLYLG